MKRPAHSENTLERIKKWREQCPELVLRSTFVVGFPSETEEDFEMLLDWLREANSTVLAALSILLLMVQPLMT
jgi:ribosomal protein S12 methylthiotransferase